MLRQPRLRLAATAAVVLAFVVTGRSSPLPVAGAAQNAALAGAANLLSTTQGVVWSFNIENGSGVVLRSADDGNRWRVVLSELASQVSFGLVASYFLGPENAWAALEEQTGATSVYRTSDGGRHWDRSDLRIVAPPPSMPILFDQLYFADPEHGWLLAVGTDLGSGSANSLVMLLWRTDDGGRTWSQLPPTSLPPQSVELPPYAGSACPVFSPPHIAFTTPNIGWWTYGACGTGAARPLVWRTRDGGRNWTPSPLSAPPGGWGSWDVLDQGGTDVGATWGGRGALPAWSTRTLYPCRAHQRTGSTPSTHWTGWWRHLAGSSRPPMQGEAGPSSARRSPCPVSLLHSPRPVTVSSKVPALSSPCALGTEAALGALSPPPSLVRYRRRGRWVTLSRRSRSRVPTWPLQRATGS